MIKESTFQTSGNPASEAAMLAAQIAPLRNWDLFSFSAFLRK
jgi:hypothetical protein